MRMNRTFHSPLTQGENQLPKVIRGVTFRDGIEVSVSTSNNAA
jgi:hypothetical protein